MKLVMRVIQSTIFLLSFGISTATAENLIGPKRYQGTTAGPTEYYTENISITPAQSKLIYKLRLKNADGLATPSIATCNQTQLLRRLFCLYSSARLAVIALVYRVDWAEVSVNGNIVISRLNFKKNTSFVEVALTLQEKNEIKILVKGSFISFVSFEIEKPVGVIDTLPPQISASANSNSLVKESIVKVSIVDQSEVTTEVYRNNVLVSTSLLKQFDINLVEGINDFILKSRDQYNNAAVDFALSQVTLDSVAPNISSNIRASYAVQSETQVIEVFFTISEPVSQLSVNGQLATKLTPTYYSTSFTAGPPGAKALTAVASDPAGNQATVQFTTTVIIDVDKPSLVLTLPEYTSQIDATIRVEIADASETVTTIKIDGVLVDTITEKLFSYLVPLGLDGVKIIEVSTVDQAGNSSVVSKTITKNTQLLAIDIISPKADVVYRNLVVEVKISSNKELKSALVNGVQVPVGLNPKLITYYTQIWNDGPFTIDIVVTDQYGATVSKSVTSSILSDKSGVWTYEECPVGE